MSFILDALKKSEQERRRQQAPSVTEQPYGQHTRNRPWWVWLVVGLLLVNFGFLMVLWLRKDSPAPAPATVSNSSNTSTTTSAGTQPTPVITTRNSEVRTLEEEASNPADPEDNTSLLLSSAASSESVPLVQAATSSVSSINSGINTYPSKSRTGLISTLENLGGSAALNLPELRLDLHVYSDNKAQRFAFINSKKYFEGQTMSEGPLVELITEEGVVLNYRSQRFLLPRQ